MTTPEVSLTTALNTLGLFGIAALQAFAMYRSKVRQDRAQVKIAEVVEKQKEIHDLVNRPMGANLAELATSREKIAHLTRNEEDILAAVAARKASDEHNSAQAKIDAEKKVMQENREKIIKDFLEGRR